MKRYNPKLIEKKWQEKWLASPATWRISAKDSSRKKKYYLLFEFPYPSGEGLHIGHCRPYIALDIIARKRRMEKYNLLFPIGWDAFGLPAENYAIKKGIHPAITTKKNIDNFKDQIQHLGISVDWAREINTTDPSYYKWTQWIFIKLFEKGLAYKAKIAINWCPKDKIGLANEEVIDGKCERCGTKVEKREKEQWLIKITEYAKRLIDDLDLVDFPERVKTQQKEWIGESLGNKVRFKVEGIDDFIEVFTTRIDTIFSGTFLVLAPGNSFIEKHKDKIENIDDILAYREASKTILDAERTKENKDITGIQLKGLIARNPATNEEIPVWVSDFVLENYGLGAVFGSAHDKRDFDLAKKYGIPLRTSVLPENQEMLEKVKNLEECFQEEGILNNSLQFDGLRSSEAKARIAEWLNINQMAEPQVTYKLRDWVFSRQRYWGEPIPMVSCQQCGWQPLPENKLPLELPKIQKYQPTDTGESPLAKMKNWINTKCPKCKGKATRETDTMPNWAGSNWYFMAYCVKGKTKIDLKNSKKLRYWLPVDWYNGGMEHTTLHLLYSRFIFKFLYDIEASPNAVGPEPYKKRTSHGIILGQGGIKMSKSKGNVVNPDQVINQYGTDILRIYEMFIGPFQEAIPWDSKGIIGAKRFLEKIYYLANSKISNKKIIRQLAEKKKAKELVALLHKTIKKVGEDIEAMKFNTAISAMMEFVNAWHGSVTGLSKGDFQKFLIILCPFAPHLAEELWELSGFKKTCSTQKWPMYNPKLVKENNIVLIVQVNGKVRDKIEVEKGLSQKDAENKVLKSQKISQLTDGKEVKKIIFVQDKLINIVI